MQLRDEKSNMAHDTCLAYVRQAMILNALGKQEMPLRRTKMSP